MSWSDWIDRDAVVAPSLYAADFGRLGEEVGALLAAGCRVFHFDTGDGHFVPPVTIGPVVLRAIAPQIHAAGGILDCHLMVSEPARHLDEFASSGADSVTFHVEATDDPVGVADAARALGLSVGIAFNPGTSPETAAEAAVAARADLVLCMSIVPGYSGQAFMPDALERIARVAELVNLPIQVDGGVGDANASAIRRAGARVLVAGSAVFAALDPASAWRAIEVAASA